MKLLMDADCLIKLTKSGLKELVGRQCEVLITASIEKEVVHAGMAKGHADAEVVRQNIATGNITVLGAGVAYDKGDDSLVGLFDPFKYDVVATDDARLVKRLKTYGIPFILPGLIFLVLLKSGRIDREAAANALDRLSEYISEDEHATVRLLLEQRS